MRQGCSLLPLLFNVVLEAQTIAIRKQKERKSIQTGRKGINFSLFADGIILYVENPNSSVQKLVKQIKEFNKVTEYKLL